MQGFHGKYLRYDLSRREGRVIELDEAVLRGVLGGVGLGSFLLHEEAPVGVEPLAPEAPLIFVFSPLVGTGITTSAKFAVVAKSPLTNRICDALASSHFAIDGKRMGYDAIVFVGACDGPSDWVRGELRPSESWGRSAEATGKALRSEGRVAAIGIAGENRVRYATISSDGRHAGRGGLGAVMGAKRLKSVVVAGDVETSSADPERVSALARALRNRANGPATAKYSQLGTIGNMLTFDRLGALPTRNFQQSHFEGAEALAGERWQGERRHRRASCAHCTIGCEHRFGYQAKGKDGNASTREARAEYESLFALGPLCGIDDPDEVLAASQRCDELGLDTISAGGTLAFAMECGERGELEGGPRFGESVLGWLDQIAAREGLGDRLAFGSRRFAEELGGDAIDRAPQVKGMELPGYEPRSLQTMALGLAVGTRGADHNRSGAYEADFSDNVDRLHGDARSIAHAIESEDRAALIDSLVLCKFVRAAFDDLFEESAELLTAVTGEFFNAIDLQSAAARIVDLRKAFNQREGAGPEEDTLPKRLLEEPLRSGPAVGARLPARRLAEMIEGYYAGRGWTAEGRVSNKRLAQLADELGLDPRKRADPVTNGEVQ